MKVKYQWFENPGEYKCVDFHNLYFFDRNFIKRCFNVDITEEEYYKGQLKILEEKKNKGLILSYEITEERA